MNVTMNDLLLQIGEISAENRLLRQENAQLQKRAGMLDSLKGKSNKESEKKPRAVPG